METIQRVHVIACGVLAADLQARAAAAHAQVTCEFLPGGLHNSPHELRRRLQEAVDRVSAEGRCDRIVVGYGVCGRGTVGLCARQVPLAIPRVQDCIALLLGSNEAYRQQFASAPGTYYISPGWVDERAHPQEGPRRADEPASPIDFDFEEIAERHGFENAEQVRHFLTSWQRNYQRAAYIDTGTDGGSDRYETLAREMAERFGWRFEKLPGDTALMDRLLAQAHTDEQILVVPPHHVTRHDPILRALTAVPVWDERAGDEPAEAQYRRLAAAEPDDEPDEPEAPAGESPAVRIGLGIDAGGTYTDAVIYDFARESVLAKAKALTTAWNYAIGIDEALSGLPQELLGAVEMVSISTTLATNAIVEGRGQPVGLLIMPPYGLFEPGDIPHRPVAVLRGRLEINGSEIEPVDAAQVAEAARAMVAEHRVGALAVAGFASHNNPAHELHVKQICREVTGLSITCGHEVSEGLNYRLRAVTAALNARIIPPLASLLEKVRAVLGERGVAAPEMVVRSDGSLMNVETALQRPIETILSGPAASVAGAQRLARHEEALVVDIGGTTTDTARIRGGAVETCREGAVVGSWRTHVQALDMRTCGLGGDSLVAWEQRRMEIGPRRVGPVCWLAARDGEGTRAALDWLFARRDRFSRTSDGLEILLATAPIETADLGGEAARVADLLNRRPRSLDELAERLEVVSPQFVRFQELCERHGVVRCGLTPTDLLHVSGRMEIWETSAAERMAEIFCAVAEIDLSELPGIVGEHFVRALARELLKKQIDGLADPDGLESEPAATALLENALDADASGGLRVKIQLGAPVVGLGAAARYFLPEAARRLGSEAVLPENGDVANAVGAITSEVRLRREVRVSPNDAGGYSLHGLADAPSFKDFQGACRFAVVELKRQLRREGRRAGTSARRVEVRIHDRTARLGGGESLFLHRVIEARLTGRPDLSVIAQQQGQD